MKLSNPVLKCPSFFVKKINSKCQNTIFLGLTQKWMIPSCCLWKVVTFFGKEHVNWFSISGVTIGRSWTIKSLIFLVNFSKLDFSTSSFNKSLKLDQMTCYLPKNVTTFHGEQDGIIHFCLSPNKMGIFDTLNLHFDKKNGFFQTWFFNFILS